MVNHLRMYTWKQESVALRALVSHSKTEEQVACVRKETGLSAAQAEELLALAAKQRHSRGAKARTFYAVAFSAGQDMAGYTIGLQAFMAAGILWFWLYLVYDGRPFLGWVCLGLMVYLLASIGAAYRSYQQHRPQVAEAIAQRG